MVVSRRVRKFRQEKDPHYSHFFTTATKKNKKKHHTGTEVMAKKNKKQNKTV
jgi:hypothetical protein